MARRTHTRKYSVGIPGQFLPETTEQADVDQVRRYVDIEVAGGHGDRMRCDAHFQAELVVGGCMVSATCTLNQPGCTARLRRFADFMTVELVPMPGVLPEIVEVDDSDEAEEPIAS